MKDMPERLRRSAIQQDMLTCELMQEAADRIEALEALLETAHPMLDRLAHYEGTINQPSAELAEQIRTVLDASLCETDGENGK